MSNSSTTIRIQEADFSMDEEYQSIRQHNANQTGAICTFTGLVREFGDCSDITGLYLEHYPGMTEKTLARLVEQAREKWDLHYVSIIHRIGQLALTEQIVFVGVSSAHRADAFAACEYIMDFLKTDAPFWKKELSSTASEWVEAKESDQQRKSKWLS